MKNLLTFFLVAFLYICFNSLSFAFENSFYILRNTSSKQNPPKNAFISLNNHYKSINQLITQAYKINEKGEISGFIHPEVISFARQHSIKLLVLITNSGFDPDKAHQFLSNPSAKQKALTSILALCKSNHFYGVQFDFEGISIKDKAALTAFYQTAANLLHQNGILVSFAIIPQESEQPPQSDFLKRKYENWCGAYDLKTLSTFADFITIMSYDQHTQGTTPGPTASIHWVEATIQYASRYIPVSKISLGIPTYSGFWHLHNRSGKPNGKLAVSLDDIRYNLAVDILNKRQAKLYWDDTNKISYAFFQKNWVNQFLFIEDARSFKPKYDLAKKYNLRGISVFPLGHEDPKIWEVLG